MFRRRVHLIAEKFARRSHTVAIAMQLNRAFRRRGKTILSLVPKTFTEKVVYKKLRDRRDYLVRTADKFAVRDYVARIAGESVLTELYAVTDDPDRLDFDSFPTSFVVKATHGSGWWFLVPDRRDVKTEEIRAVAVDWLRQDWGLVDHERWYSRIPPRLIVEEYLGDSTDNPPPDYKFYVMHGRVEMIHVALDRLEGPKLKFYTPQWEPIDVTWGSYQPYHGEVEPPPNLDRMMRLASALGAGTDFVRVDLYDLGDRVVFGELTHCPGAGHDPFSDPEVELWLGSRWRVPLRYRDEPLAT